MPIIRPKTAFLLLATSGCSFFAVRPTPRPDPQTGIERCEGVGFVVADLLGTVALSLGGAYYNALTRALNDRCGVGGYSQSGCSATVVPFIPALILGASTIYGAASLGACSKKLPPS